MQIQHKTNKRIRGRSAFTLAELLIVLAIIGVLVAVSIPIFNMQLEKSREATDIANMRAAKAAAIDLYYAGITDQKTANSYGLYWYNYNASNPKAGNIWGVYDAETGKFIYASSWNNMGFSYNALGDYQKAIESLQRAIEIDPSLANPWRHMGTAYKNLGNREKAIECYRKAIELNPDYEKAKEDLNALLG